MISCCCVSSFYNEYGLVPLGNQHKTIENPNTVRGAEDIRVNECVAKCYGSGVHIVDNYDGNSSSLELRCRSLPWGIKKFLSLGEPVVTIALERRELRKMGSRLFYFACMCIYPAEGTLIAGLNLYFAPCVESNIDHVMSLFLHENPSMVPPSFASAVSAFIVGVLFSSSSSYSG
jgi:hypothetical protein